MIHHGFLKTNLSTLETSFFFFFFFFFFLLKTAVFGFIVVTLRGVRGVGILVTQCLMPDSNRPVFILLLSCTMVGDLLIAKMTLAKGQGQGGFIWWHISWASQLTTNKFIFNGTFMEGNKLCLISMTTPGASVSSHSKNWIPVLRISISIHRHCKWHVLPARARASSMRLDETPIST